MSLRETVYKSVRGSNIEIAIFSTLAILAGIIGFVGVAPLIKLPPQFLNIVGTSKFVMRHFGQPQVLTSEQVALLTPDQLPLYNVQIVANAVHNLDGKSFEYTYSGGNDVIQQYYGILEVEGGDVLFRSPAIANESQLAQKGTLRIPWEETTVEMYDEFNAEYANIADQGYRLYPFILDAGDNVWYWFIPALVEAILIIGGAVGFGIVTWRRDPKEHPIIKSLARYGDVEGVISEIDGEITDGNIARVDNFQFTENWLIYKAGNKMSFIRLEDVLWFYAQSVRSRYGTNHFLYVFDRSGQKLTVQINGSGKRIEAMFNALSKYVPWAIGGYSKEVEKSWKKDREGFGRMVDVRRIQINTPQAQ